MSWKHCIYFLWPFVSSLEENHVDSELTWDAMARQQQDTRAMKKKLADMTKHEKGNYIVIPLLCSVFSYLHCN